MPAKTLIVDPLVRKRLQKLPVQINRRVIDAFDRIQQNPLAGVKLHGDLENYRKLRLGDYRIVYLFNSKTSTVFVVIIEHRQGVYK